MKAYKLTISRNLYFTLFVLLFSGSALFAQSLEKGNLVGLHTMTVNLDPDVTMNQYKDFLRTKWIPAIEKHTPGMKAYLLQAIRGENQNSLGIIFMFNSDEDRNKYWNADGTPTELQQAVGEKMQAINAEANKCAVRIVPAVKVVVLPIEGDRSGVSRHGSEGRYP